MVVLAIGAHPDDIEFGCFGTLARMSRKEKIFMLVFTRGEIAATPEVRISEAIKSAAMIGASVSFLSHPDGGLQQTAETVRELRDEITKRGADTIFSPHMEDSHQDHATAGRIAISSWKLVNRVLFYESPTTFNFQPNIYCDITETFEIKRQALDSFQSQKSKPSLETAQVRGLAQYRAWQCDRRNKLFEAFVIARAIKDG